MSKKIKKKFPALFVASYLLVAVAMVGFVLFPVLNTKASVKADFTVTNVSAATFGPNYTDQLVLDVVIPDAWNGGAFTADIVQKAGSNANIWQGDALNAITALGSVTGVGYKNDVTAGFQGTEPVVRDLDADSVYTLTLDTLIINNTDAPSAGDTLYDMAATDYYIDADHGATYTTGGSAEAWVLDDGDVSLTAGALNGTGTDDVIFDGQADIAAFAATDFVADANGSDNNDYDDGEAIFTDDDGTIDPGALNAGNTQVVTSGDCDLNEDLTGGINGLHYNDEDAGATWTAGEDIFLDDDNDNKYTSQADTAADCDGTATTSGTGTCAGISAGTSYTALAGTENLCTDSLTVPTVIYVDGDGDCTSGSGGVDTTLRDEGGGIGSATTSVGTNWKFNDDGTVNGSWDAGDDLYFNGNGSSGTPGTTYSFGADTPIYDGSSDNSGNDAINHDDALSAFIDADNVMYIDSNHGGSYGAGEPLITTSGDIDPGGDITSSETVLIPDQAIGSWGMDWTSMAGITDIGYCDHNNNATYDNGEAVIQESAGAIDSLLESSDTVLTTGSAIFTSFPNTYAKTDAASDISTDIYDEETLDSHTYSAGADTDVYSTGGLAAGDALTNFGADCDGAGGGLQACLYTGSAPIDSTESILIDDGTAGGGAPNSLVDRQTDQLIGMGIGTTGTAVDSTDISQVKAWAEDGTSPGFQPGEDTSLGIMTAHANSTEWWLGGLSQAVSGGGLQLYFTVDITATPTHNSTLRFGTYKFADVGADGVVSQDGDRGFFMSSNNDGPTDAVLVNTSTQTIDSQPPTVTGVTPNDAVITEADAGADNFYLDIDYSENMDAASTPLVTFNPDIVASGTLALSASSTWTDADTYRIYYDVADVNETQTLIGIGITAATDAVGNTQTAYAGGGSGVSVDTVAPTIISVVANPNSGLAKVGDTITATLTAGGLQNDLFIAGACTINAKDVSGSFVNNTDGTYTLSYTVVEGDTDQAAGALPIFCVLNEPVGNSVTPAAFTDGNTLAVDANSPTIISVVANPNSGTAKVGDTVTVTITAGGAQSDLGIAGACTINAKDVSGSFVNNADGTYTLSYTVVEGDTDRAAGALPISCVLAELSGNSVTPAAFTDGNTLAVDANSPVLVTVIVTTGSTVDVVFSEPMGALATVAGNYNVSGTGLGTFAANPTTSVNTAPNTYTLTWGAGEMYNGGDITVTVNAAVTDVAQNPINPAANSGTDVGGAMGVLPSVLSATTNDADSNGQIDELVVVYDEAVNDANYDAVAVTGYVLPGTGSGTGTATLTYDLTESGTSDTGATPALTWTAANAADLAGNILNTAGAPANAADGADPVIVSTVPANGAASVYVNQNIIVNFSEPMATGTVTYASTPDPGGWGVSWNPANDQVTYTHINYATGASVQFDINTGDDLNANSLAGAPVSWTFTTVSGGGGGGGTLPPSNTSVVINDDDAETLTKYVSLQFTASNASQIKVSNVSDLSDAEWQTFNSLSMDWTLSDYSGTKTVYVKFKSSGGESSIVTDSIEYTAPQEELPTEEPAEEEGEEELPEGTVVPELATGENTLYITGRWVKTADLTAVYMLDENNVRHTYPTQAVYESYFGLDFSRVEIISDQEMASYSLGKNVPFNVGSLIKMPNNPKVYEVGVDGVLYWIENEATAKAMFGSDWASLVRDLPEEFFPGYTYGPSKSI